MTKKQMITCLSLGLLFLATFGFAWNWFITFNSCNQKENRLTNLMQDQERWLYNYAYLNDLKLEDSRLNTLKETIKLREKAVKTQIEQFAESCKSKPNKDHLMSMLHGLNYYLISKQTLFQEKQNFSWIRDLTPSEYNFKE